jgi:predicted RNA-binding protein with PUA-like domain
MKYFLAKSEPEGDFSIEDLQRVGVEPWTGIHSYQAIGVLKTWEVGDKIFMYHSVKNSCIAGLMEVVSVPEKDMNDTRGISWFANVKFIENYPIEKRISLKTIKESSLFNDFALVRQSRLSVMLCPQEFVDWVLEKVS